jgi:O-antigen ligase
MGLAVAALVMGSSALFPLLYAPTTLEADTSADSWLRYLWLPVYGVTAFLAVLNWRDLRQAARAFIPFAVILGLAGASILWSIAPDITLRRWEALAFNGLLAFTLAARFAWGDLVRIIAAALLILAIGSLVMGLGFPARGVHVGVNAGAWRGLWLQKNELGFMMVIGALSALASAAIDRQRRLVWLGAAALAFALLVLSRSGTSLLCLMSSASLLAAFGLSRKRPVIALMVTFLAGCFAVTLAIFVLTDVDALFSVMGKDPTLTGRTDVWTAVLRRIAERPALGYGYAAFWHDPFGPALLVRREAGWAVPTAHNGWLEVLLQLGWSGTVLVGLYFVLTAVAAMRGLFSRGDGFWAIMYVGAFAMLSFSESEIMRQNSLEWTLFVATSTKLIIDWIRKPRPAQPFLAVARAA